MLIPFANRTFSEGQTGLDLHHASAELDLAPIARNGILTLDLLDLLYGQGAPNKRAPTGAPFVVVMATPSAGR